MPEIIVKLGDRVIHRYHFDKEMLSVGRARDNDIVIENLSVSRNHARIKKQDGKYILTDMNSANGTLVNGVRVTKTEVAHNDEITVGKHMMIFLMAEESRAPNSQNATLSEDSVEIDSGLVGVMVVTKGKQVGQEFRIEKPETLIGRASENDIRIHDWFVSKRHASLTRQGATFTLRDLDSWRGTTVNGSSVKEIELKDGDELIFGTTVVSFRRAEAASLPAPAAPPAIEDNEDWESAPPAELDRVSGSGFPGITSDQINVAGISPGPAPAPTAPAAAARPETPEELYGSFGSQDLDKIEADFEAHLGSEEEEEEGRRSTWEMVEMERTFDTGGETSTPGLVEEDPELRAAEEAFIGKAVLAATKFAHAAWDDAEEELSLYGAPMTDREPLGEVAAAPAPAPAVVARALAPTPPPPPPLRPHDAIPHQKIAPATPAPGVVPASSDPKAVNREVAMWEKALQNKSSVIRKNAAKELKKLTGKDYDWTIEPSSN